MAKKPQKLIALTMTEIILRGDAETIRQALEARIQIDTLLEEREAAYKRIAELETQVCDIVGEDGVFPFPAPPMPVASYVTPAAPKKKVESTPEVSEKAATEEEAQTDSEKKETAPAEAEETSEENEESAKTDDA